MAHGSSASLKDFSNKVAAAKNALIALWDAKINEDDGSFEAVFGDPSETPYAVRVSVYYDENEESAVDIGLEAVTLGHFEEEESFSDQDFRTLEGMIEDAIPLMDSAIFEFAAAVYDALLAVEQHPSFHNADIEEYRRLKKKEDEMRSEEKDRLRMEEEKANQRAKEVAKAKTDLAKNYNRAKVNEAGVSRGTTYMYGVSTADRVTIRSQKSVMEMEEWKLRIDQWRAGMKGRAQHPDLVNVMTIIDAERNPHMIGKRRVGGAPVVIEATLKWTEEEEAMWEYLEIVACARQRIFQCVQSRLTHLPLCLGRLTALEEINVSENKLVTVPAEVLQLPNLRRLYLHNNLIKALPDISGCEKLETLLIQNNRLTEVPNGIGSLQMLKGFDAERNKIRDIGDLVLCPKIDYINLNHNLIKTVPAELATLSSLQYLLLKNNPIVNLPPHIYIQGMAAIIAYIAEHANLSAELVASSLSSDFLARLTSGAMSDIEIVATKSREEPVISKPFTQPEIIASIDDAKVLGLLNLDRTSKPTPPSSLRAHSLILLSRLPILRERIIMALKSETPVLSLSVTPDELQVLMNYAYSDVFHKPIPPSYEMAQELSRKAPELLNSHEVETLRYSMVAIWRNWLLNVDTLSREYDLSYLGVLARTALGLVIDKETAPSSTFKSDFASILPISSASGMSVHELNMDEAMKAITDGFSHLSHESPEAALSSSTGLPKPSSSQTSSNEHDLAGISSPAYAPIDIAFRVMDDPTAPLIGAHKFVLCARSKFLENMLTGGLLESTQTVVTMSDISYDTLKAIIEFCYTDDVTDIHGDMIMELLMKARLFGLDRLLGYVESIVGYSLDATNVVSIANVAFVYQLSRLQKATKFYILSHWLKVTRHPSWAEIDPNVKEKLQKTAIKWEIIEAPKPTPTIAVLSN